MDYFAHGFWSFILFHRFRWRWTAVIFALLPDTASWFIFLLYNRVTRTVDWSAGRPDISSFPDWIWMLYNISHSIFVWIALFGILWLIFRRPIWPVTAGFIAILMDIPTHSRDFLPTPFLWPFSDWTFPGFSWSNGWFMLFNYCLLAALYAYFFLIKPWREQRLFLRKPAVHETRILLPTSGKKKSIDKKTRTNKKTISGSSKKK